MIIAVVVSIISAQGALGQEKLSDFNSNWESSNYESEALEYTEIESLDLPFSIKSSVSKDYQNLYISKAYISKDNTYKLVLNGMDKSTKVLFASADGQFIKPNDKS